MSDVPRSSRSQSRASERSPPTRPASTKPKPIAAKPEPMGPPPAPSSGGADDLDEFDFMSKIPSPVMSLPQAPRAKSGGTQPKRKKPVFEDFMDLIPASQRVVWSSSGAPVIKPAASGDSTADDSPSPAAEDTVSTGASYKEPRVSDTMEVDDGGKEARTTIPAAPTEPRSLPKARPVVQNKARDVQPRGSGTHVTKPRGRTQSVGTILQNPDSSAGPSAGPPSSGQPTHPMGIVVPPPRNPQELADLEARSNALKTRLAHLWETLTKVRGEMTQANDEVHKAVLEVEAIAKSLG
ncbi:hypothetical protein EDB85DRAFT_2140089 [Lactarius pseudohatsudake]|nr:hypothetical protein EDB85DRAFT_2140089 [Lactarius pseudohatsudake]